MLAVVAERGLRLEGAPAPQAVAIQHAFMAVFDMPVQHVVALEPLATFVAMLVLRPALHPRLRLGVGLADLPWLLGQLEAHSLERKVRLRRHCQCQIRHCCLLIAKTT